MNFKRCEFDQPEPLSARLDFLDYIQATRVLSGEHEIFTV